MKKTTFLFFALFCSFSILAQKPDNYSLNELIIKFKQKSNLNLKKCLVVQKFDNKILNSLNSRFEVQKIVLTGNKKEGNTYILKFKTDIDIYEVIKTYENTNLFEYVEPNYIGRSGGKQALLQTIPNDIFFSRQWGLYNDGTFPLSYSTNDADIDMELAWDIEQGSSSIVIAVLDSGIKLNHPDLNKRVWFNSNESSNNKDDDDNGYIDDIRGWDFVNNDNNPTDDNGHGTNVAGIIGADANNNIGYSGVDWKAKLMICKITNSNSFGYYSWWTEAIYYAVDNGANVINMSVGGSEFSFTMQDAINYAHNKGVIIVACMMNDNNSVKYYPAGYKNTIAVGSTNPNDERSSPFFWSSTSGSNFGNHIDVVAPGNYIYGLNYKSNTNFNTYWGGTSQATPLVTGLSALLLAQDPNRTPDDIRNIIRNTAEDQVGNPKEDKVGFDKYYGYGRINAHKALLQKTIGTTEFINEDNNLIVYPNPFSEFLNITCDKTTNIISINNILGKELYRKEIKSNQQLFKIDVSNLSEGVYLLNAFDKYGKTIQSKKVIKK